MNIILPSEVQAREFDGKLLLACVLAERGHTAIIGARHDIHNRIARLAPDVYFAKDLAKSSERILGIIRGLGSSVAVLDEEGIIWPSQASYFRRRTTPVTVAATDVFCTWGPRHTRLTKDIPGIGAQPVIETGNPRIDMLRPELSSFHAPEVARLKEAYGRFILINSNFGIVNPMVNSKNNTPEAMQQQHPDIVRRYEKRKVLFRAFCDLLPKLCAAFPAHQVIVRPHPSERMSAWQEVSTGSPNLSVVYEGGIIPWLLAASATIHNECSTGFESFVMGRISISYMGEAERPDHALSSDFFSEIVPDQNAVIAAVARRLKGDRPTATPAQQSEFAHHISAFEGSLAAERITDVLVNMGRSGPRQAKAVREAEYRGAKKRVLGLIPGHKAGAGHNNKRYPGVSRDDLDDKIARLRQALGRFHGISAQSLGGHIYRITSA